MKRPGQPLRLKASEISKAIRAGEKFDSLLTGRGSAVAGSVPVLKTLVRNGHATDIPAYGLTRWFGDPLEAAEIDGNVPNLTLRTTTDTTRPIGVAVNQILAADSPTPAGIGQVQIMGVCWARVFGEFTAGDSLGPDSSFRGILDTSGFSNVKALSDGPGSGTEGIIPVLIGGGSGVAPVSGSFVKQYTLAIRGTATTGTISWEARKTVDVSGTPTLVTVSGTWDSDADDADILASLISFDSGVRVIGGDIRWNTCKIRFSDTTASLLITATSLTRETHGITPQAELSWCFENEDAWWM